MSFRLISLMLLLLPALMAQADGCRYEQDKGNKQRDDGFRGPGGMATVHHKCGGHRHSDGEHRHEGKHRGRCDHDEEWDIPEADANQLNPIAVSAESLQRGEALYQNNCRRCHGTYGMGDGPDAKTLDERPANLRRAAHHHSDGELSYMIRTGRSPMPAWQDKLSQKELWDLINYIRFEIGRPRGPMGRKGMDR